MAFDDFHCIVVGNEPAGLWLLNALEASQARDGKKKRLGWISLRSETAPVAFPTAFCADFDISPTIPWSADIVVPGRTLTWNQPTIEELFAGFPSVGPAGPRLNTLAHPTGKELDRVRRAIQLRPELVDYAQALWKGLGRAQDQSPEALVHFSRFLTELQWWEPQAALSSSVERILFSPVDNPIVKFRPQSNETLSMDFRDFGEVTSEHWVLNCDLRTLERLTLPCQGLVSLLNLDADLVRVRALYPQSLLVQPEAIPSPVPPLTLATDSASIPDPETEIWPLTLQGREGMKELTVWASAPALSSLEAILDQFRCGMSTVHRLFPFLAGRLQQVGVPLGMDSCFNEASCHEAAERLQERSLERYDRTGFCTQTRSAFLHLLLPYLGCHLPYPIGTLLAARRVLADLVGAQPRRRSWWSFPKTRSLTPP